MSKILKFSFLSCFFIFLLYTLSNGYVHKEQNDKKKQDIYSLVLDKYKERIVDISDSDRIYASVTFSVKETNYNELNDFILSLGFIKVGDRDYCKDKQYMGMNFYDGVFYLKYFYPDTDICIIK